MKRRLPGLAVVAAVLAATATAAGARSPASDGVLVGPLARESSLSEAGLLLATPNGRVRRVLAPAWSLVAAGGPSGPFAATRRGSATERRPLVVIADGRARVVPASADARCASWSHDGRTLSYLTGTVATWSESQPRYPTLTFDGTLWVVDRRSPRRPQAVRRGVFALSECPTWAPTARALAYVASLETAWSLAVWRRGAPITVAELETLSTQYRTFEWLPGTRRLVFLDADTLYTGDGAGAAERVTAEGALSEVGTPADRFVHGIRLSPNGRLVAVSIGRETAVFTRTGQLVRKVAGTFNGWAGNTGVLTLRAEPDITLRLHPLSGALRSKVLATSFKSGVVTHPSGRWFAHADVEGGSRISRAYVFFRRPNGSILRRIPIADGFYPWLQAGVTRDGRVLERTSAY